MRTERTTALSNSRGAGSDRCWRSSLRLAWMRRLQDRFSPYRPSGAGAVLARPLRPQRGQLALQLGRAVVGFLPAARLLLQLLLGHFEALLGHFEALLGHFEALLGYFEALFGHRELLL